MGLEKAAENSNIEVGGIAGPLAWWYHKRGPVPSDREKIITLASSLPGDNTTQPKALLFFNSLNPLISCMVRANDLLTSLAHSTLV